MQATVQGTFAFDHVFPQHCAQDTVYQSAVRPLVDNILSGVGHAALLQVYSLAYFSHDSLRLELFPSCRLTLTIS